MFTKLAILAASCLSLCAGQPQLRSLTASWPPYTIPSGCSNAVVVWYKSTSLGTVFTPFKPCAYFPATRTNGHFAVLSGQLYHFYATVQGKPLLESDPSNVCTNSVP